MATITTRSEWLKQLAKGKGYSHYGRSIGAGANTTAAAAASGFASVQLMFNLVGTTIPGTLVGHQLPPVPSAELLSHHAISSIFGGRAVWLVRLYRFGTLNLAATGNQFTHDGTFVELRRTRFGEASKPINLIPIVYITTATTTTAPVFRLRTVAGGAGYANCFGNAIVGTVTMTMPAAATAVNSGFIIRLEKGDGGVRNISNIEVTTAGAAGAASIFGAEILAPITILQTNNSGFMDSLFGGLGPMDLAPAVPDAGVVTSYLAWVILGSTTTPSGNEAHHFDAALNNV